MLTIPLASLRVFVALEPLDMRKQFDGLAGAVRRELGGDPLSGQIFCRRRSKSYEIRRRRMIVWTA